MSEEQLPELPSNWAWAGYKDCIETISDQSLRVEQRDYLNSGELPVVDQGENLVGGYTNNLSKTYTGPLPVIVFGDHTRRVKFIDFPFAVGAQGVKLLRPLECWVPKFLYYLIPTLPLPDRGYSRHFQFLRKLRFPLPPLAQQQRIVAEIEKQLSRIEAATAGLRRAQANLKAYRAAVLKAACEGRLGLSDNESYSLHAWNWKTIAQLSPPGRACAYGVLQPGPDTPEGVPFVRVGDINNGKVDRTSLKRISPQIAAAYPRTKLQGGEVLITLVGTIGRTAVVPQDLAGANTARAVGVVPIAEGVEPSWVEIWLRNPARRAEMISKAHEVARKTLNLEGVRGTIVGLPPHRDQLQIVAEVERRCSILDELERAVGVNLSRADHLKRSILIEAFEGRLVPQDPSEEPASILIKRLGEARENRTSKRGTQPQRGRGIKPGVSTPGNEPQHPPKPRRGAGNNVRESASAPSGLPGESGDASLGLKPQALRPGPFRAVPDGDGGVTQEQSTKPVKAEEKADFLGLSREEQIDHAWEALLGLGAVEKDHAIRTVANDLREKGLARFQRLRQGGGLYEAISAAIGRGVRAGSFDRPRRGTVRALLIDGREYSPKEWRRCLLGSLNNHAVNEEDALRTAAEWAGENMGLEFSRLREDGVILRGLREALNDAVRRGEIQRKHGQIRVLES